MIDPKKDDLELNFKMKMAKTVLAAGVGYLAKEGFEKLFDIWAKHRLAK